MRALSAATGPLDPDRRPLARSPLVNVVWQVRLSQTPALEKANTAVQLRTALGVDSMTPVSASQFAVQVGAGPGPVQMAENVGQAWRFSDTGGTTTFSVSSQSLSVETTQYSSWEGHFYEQIERAVNALAQVEDIGVVVRVGMRYINAVFGAAIGAEPFTEATALRDIAVQPLLGFLVDDTLSGSINGLQGQHVLALDDGIVSHIQHGIVATDGGEMGMLLDIDTFKEEAVAFDRDVVLTLADTIHLNGLSLFQRCIKPEALRLMGPQGS